MHVSASSQQSDAYHAQETGEVVQRFATDAERGLATAEAAERLERYGPNQLPTTGGRGLLMRILHQFHHPLIYVLIVAGIVTLVMDAHVDSAVIFGVVVVNAIVGFIQESKAEAELNALRSMLRTEARVVRDGREQSVPAEDLVPGDLVMVDAGDMVPADIRVARLEELRVDESALTGESVPCGKDGAVLPDTTPVADRDNMLHSGTLVTAGRGSGVVVATGAHTQLGEIHRLVGEAELLATPLTRKLTHFSKILTVAILVLAALTFGVGMLHQQELLQTFTAAIALAVGAIPEGLPAVVTITLAIGVARMARRRAVTRRLPVVETLGSTTVICSDKTGTLTKNQMTVGAVWTPDTAYEVTGAGYAVNGEVRRVGDTDGAAVDVSEPEVDTALRWSLLAGAACNDATLTCEGERCSLIGDPTEGALLVSAAKAGLPWEGIGDAYPRLATIPFSSERRYMATLHREAETGEHVVLVKGAVERLLAICDQEMGADGTTRPLDRDAVLSAADDLARQGLRVLATARCPIDDPAVFDPDSGNGVSDLAAEGAGDVDTATPGADASWAQDAVFTGLQAMLDPPREAAISAVEACRTAGISVRMITGDHATTASAIAERFGLLDGDRPGQVLTGADLEALSEEEYPDAVDRARVFARVSPGQKLQLVEALQAHGHQVAMTGDGVNDAPALRQANIGIAMGLSGTEVAKEASDMVLTDDDFATIEAAVEEGRGVFDNLTKYIVWTLPTNMGEGLIILIAVMIAASLPIMPTQILWINMTTALCLGLMLAFEPKEEGIMRRPPRDTKEPLVGRAVVGRMLLVATLLVGAAWLMFEWQLADGKGLDEARTAAVNVFIAVKIVYLLSCRSLTRSVRQLGPFSNPWIMFGISLQVIGQLLFTYVPSMNLLFYTAPIDVETWLRIIAVALLAGVVIAIHKRLLIRREGSRQLEAGASPHTQG
ncbi:cation-transporting ATPase F [Nocardiopsis mwathae]|uniref:Cation-transporting ATPase F n=1 Tax=Nocardiopsis mwathae TaxID=1472723 RepID=A0A7X0D5G9_9ACTN|nr:HAD-IC family P-type ATPase [Nocardiopsis mwathae]MBB6171681.1 cation-transporting ATPase F [Nocardiopsis mwathae]